MLSELEKLSLLNIVHRRRTRYRVPSGEAIALAYTVAVVWSWVISSTRRVTRTRMCSPAHLCAVTFEEVSFPLQNQIAVCNRPTPFSVFYVRLKIYYIANDVCRYTLQFGSVCVMDWSKLLCLDWKIKGHEFTCKLGGGAYAVKLKRDHVTSFAILTNLHGKPCPFIFQSEQFKVYPYAYMNAFKLPTIGNNT